MKNLDYIEQLVSGDGDSGKKEQIISDIENSTDQKEAFSKLKIAWALLSSTKQMPQYKIEKSYARHSTIAFWGQEFKGFQTLYVFQNMRQCCSSFWD